MSFRFSSSFYRSLVIEEREERFSFLGAWLIKLLVGALVCTVSNPLIIRELLLLSCVKTCEAMGYILDGNSSSLSSTWASRLCLRDRTLFFSVGLSHTITTMFARTNGCRTGRLLFFPFNQHLRTKSHKKHKVSAACLPFRDHTSRLKEEQLSRSFCLYCFLDTYRKVGLPSGFFFWASLRVLFCTAKRQTINNCWDHITR